jgi:hypothetical protein
MPARMGKAGDATDDVLTAEEQLANPRLRAFREQITSTTTRIVYYNWAGEGRPLSIPDGAITVTKRPLLIPADASAKRPRAADVPTHRL